MLSADVNVNVNLTMCRRQNDNIQVTNVQYNDDMYPAYSTA